MFLFFGYEKLDTISIINLQNEVYKFNVNSIYIKFTMLNQ